MINWWMKRMLAKVVGREELRAGLPPKLCMNVQPMIPADERKYLHALRDIGVTEIRTTWHNWFNGADLGWVYHYQDAGVSVMPMIKAEAGVPAEKVGVSIARRHTHYFRHFGPTSYVQLENEVDGDGLFGLTESRDPFIQGYRWGTQMGIAADRIHDVDPYTRIVSAGLAWNRPRIQDFIRGLMNSRHQLDVLAIHIYGHHLHGEPIARHKEVRAAGWNGPLWATEIGVDNAAANAVGWAPDWWQLDCLQNLSRDSNRHAYDRLYWFQLNNDPEGWGIYGRPAFDFLQKRKRL